jgi:hypothetical protein
MRGHRFCGRYTRSGRPSGSSEFARASRLPSPEVSVPFSHETPFDGFVGWPNLGMELLT